jgi:cell division protein ZapA (FtsZ GTPase activity inhibitor)
MDIVQATMAAILLAKEIRQIMESGKEITEEQLAILIAGNLVKLPLTIKTIQDEIAKYGKGVK